MEIDSKEKFVVVFVFYFKGNTVIFCLEPYVAMHGTLKQESCKKIQKKKNRKERGKREKKTSCFRPYCLQSVDSDTIVMG